MDRTNPRLAPSVDALHPAVLRLIEQTVAGARAHGRWVGICGGLASDSQAVPILIGLGVDELSVSVPAIPAIKAQVRRLRLAECREIATRALASAEAREVRALVDAGEPSGSSAVSLVIRSALRRMVLPHISSTQRRLRMQLHRNAKTTPSMRALLVHRIQHDHWPALAAATAAGISVRTTQKWLRRHRLGGGPPWTTPRRGRIAARGRRRPRS